MDLQELKQHVEKPTLAKMPEKRWAAKSQRAFQVGLFSSSSDGKHFIYNHLSQFLCCTHPPARNDMECIQAWLSLS